VDNIWGSVAHLGFANKSPDQWTPQMAKAAKDLAVRNGLAAWVAFTDTTSACSGA
jgi:hypothetical protein